MTTMNITININTLKVSDQAKRDRWDRITDCINTLGIGEILIVTDSVKRKYTNERVIQALTSTGLMFIINLDKNLLITAYACNIRAACAMYGVYGYTRIPDALFRTINRNQTYHSRLYSQYI